jgi:4-amino-4-deoxy-L-arabinose transferase-like glycosyltransferase
MKRVFFPIVLILAIASFLRLWDLHEIPPGLYHDEALNANQAREAWREKNFKIFYPENNGREGLFINLQALSIKAFGATPFAVRFPSAVFGILTTLGLYFLTKSLFYISDPQNQKSKIKNQNDNAKFKNFYLAKNERIALFATFFLATSFWHINFSRIGFRAIMAPFFLVWAFYFLWKLIGTFQSPLKSPSYTTFYAAIGGLLFGLGFHSYIAYRVAPLLLIIPFLVGWQIYNSTSTIPKIPPLIRGGRGGGCLPCLLALFIFFAFIVAYPLGLYFLEHSADFIGRSSQVSIFSSETPMKDLGKNIITSLGMFFWRGDYNWRHNVAGSPQLWLPVSMLFLMGIVVSIRGLIQKSKIKNQNNSSKSKILHFAFCILHSFFTSTYGFVFMWLLAFLLPVILSNEGIPHALRALPLAIPALIFAAVGLEWIIEKVSQWLDRQKEKYPEASLQILRIKKELILLLFVLFITIGLYGFGQYFLRWAPDPDVSLAFNDSYADLGRFLATLPDTTKKYVIVNAYGHVLVDNIPMPAQTVLFFTDSMNMQKRNKKNITYIPSLEHLSELPQTLPSPTVIAMLENSPVLRNKLKTLYPELQSTITPGGLVLTNY